MCVLVDLLQHLLNLNYSIYLNNDLLKTEEVLQVEINGDFYNASIIDKPCYDESGEKLRQ